MTDYASAQAKPCERFAYAPRGTCEGDGVMKIIGDPNCPGDKFYAISKVAKFDAAPIGLPVARFDMVVKAVNHECDEAMARTMFGDMLERIHDYESRPAVSNEAADKFFKDKADECVSLIKKLYTNFDPYAGVDKKDPPFWGPGIADQLAGAPSLSDFTASIEKYLLPLLPGKLRCVTDACGKLPDLDNPAFVCWVVDERGREVYEFTSADVFDEIDAVSGRELAKEIASALMSRQARG